MKRVYQHLYPYFVTTRTIKLRQGLFEDIVCADIAADVIRTADALLGCFLYGFVIMPDHLHLLIQTKDNAKDISSILSIIKDKIYKRIREEFSIIEPFWQKSFYANIKNNKELFDTAIVYMKENPCKWYLPERYAQYPYQYYNDELIEKCRGTLRGSGVGIL